MITSKSQIRKPKLREVKSLAQGHTAGEGRSRGVNPQLSDSKTCTEQNLLLRVKHKVAQETYQNIRL